MNQQAPKLHLPFEYFSWRGHAWRDLFGLLFLTGYLLKNAFALKTISPPLLVNWAILAILLVYLWRAILRGLTTRIRLTSTSLSEKTLFGTTTIPLEKLFAVTVVKTPSPLWTTSVKALLVRGMGERLLLPLPVPEEIIAVLRLHNERLFVCELPPETPREVALREELLDLLTHEGIVTSGADRLDEPRREAPWLLSKVVRNLLLGIDGLALAAFLLYGSVVKAHSFWMVSVLFWIVTGATGGLLWYNQARERACEQALQEEEGFDDKKGFECLGWLVERIGRDKVVRKRLSQLLLRSDRQVYSRLTNRQRKRLMKYLLDMEGDRELQEAIISCLVRAGEVKAIPVLEIFLERGRHIACPTELKRLAREGQESLKRFAVRPYRRLPRIPEEWNRARAEELLRSSGEGTTGQQTSGEEER